MMTKHLDNAGYRLFVGVGNGPILDRSLALREDVFVRELQYEPTAHSKGDEHSVHFVISKMGGGRQAYDVGSSRLVLASGNRAYNFPCQEVFDKHGLKDQFNLMSAREQSSECSRLVVLQQFRHTEIGPVQQTRFADVLMIANLKAASMIGLEGGYILVKRGLAKHVQEDFGLTLETVVAKSVEHNGMRTCYWVNADPAAHKMTPYAQALFGWVEKQLHPYEGEILRSGPVHRLKLKAHDSVLPKVA